MYHRTRKCLWYTVDYKHTGRDYDNGIAKYRCLISQHLVIRMFWIVYYRYAGWCCLLFPMSMPHHYPNRKCNYQPQLICSLYFEEGSNPKQLFFLLPVDLLMLPFVKKTFSTQIHDQTNKNKNIEKRESKDYLLYSTQYSVRERERESVSLTKNFLLLFEIFHNRSFSIIYQQPWQLNWPFNLKELSKRFVHLTHSSTS